MVAEKDKTLRGAEMVYKNTIAAADRELEEKRVMLDNMKRYPSKGKLL
jgi:hypothetical protein